MFMLALAAIATVPAAVADPAVGEITRLEQQWGQAFVTRDFSFIERIVAQEYRLVGSSPDGKYDITRRPEWMKNAQAFSSLAANNAGAATAEVTLCPSVAASLLSPLWVESGH